MEPEGTMTTDSRPPDWAVARAFYEARGNHCEMYNVWFLLGLDQIETRAREIAEEEKGD